MPVLAIPKFTHSTQIVNVSRHSTWWRQPERMAEPNQILELPGTCACERVDNHRTWTSSRFSATMTRTHVQGFSFVFISNAPAFSSFSRGTARPFPRLWALSTLVCSPFSLVIPFLIGAIPAGRGDPLDPGPSLRCARHSCSRTSARLPVPAPTPTTPRTRM
jgi:hypothetical protein